MLLLCSEVLGSPVYFTSLEPRLSIPDFVSQLWRKFFSKAARQNPESLGLRLYFTGYVAMKYITKNWTCFEALPP